MATPSASSAPPASAPVQGSCAVHGLTDDEFNQLRAHATAAKSAAYCPYSRFRVGAAVLAADGSLIVGANVENASYPVGTCAERVAMVRAVVDGRRRLRAVAVATDADGPASPCGMCRQFMREFLPESAPVLMFDKDENFVIVRLEQLLPMSFGPSHLLGSGALQEL